MWKHDRHDNGIGMGSTPLPLAAIRVPLHLQSGIMIVGLCCVHYVVSSFMLTSQSCSKLALAAQGPSLSLLGMDAHTAARQRLL